MNGETQLVFDEKYWSYLPRFIPNSEDVYRSLLPQLEKTCGIYTINMYGKVFESRKISCIFVPDVNDVKNRTDAKSKGFDYNETPAFDWVESPPEIRLIKELIEKTFGYKIDYVLCHIYRGLTIRKKVNGEDIEEVGQDYIGWHNDKEALDSEIFSVSLGATRRFQFRHLDNKKGCADELILRCGDLVHMKGPREKQKSCQRVYKHQVPQMSINDLVAHVEECNTPTFEGRKTYTSLKDHIKKYDIAPTRINLTFRQYED